MMIPGENLDKYYKIVLITVLLSVIVSGNLEDVLKSYETLHRKDVTHRITKRSADSASTRELKFHALGREFNLHLERNLEILQPGFQIYSLDKHNNARKVDVDVNIIYHGYLIGTDDSNSVHATFETAENGDEDFSVTIRTEEEIYVVEPSWRHLPKSNNHTMIAYKGSDINLEEDFGSKYCGFVRENGEDDAAYDTVDHTVEDVILDGHSQGIYTVSRKPSEESIPEEIRVGKVWVARWSSGDNPSDRYKRQVTYSVTHTPDKDTCSLLLVSDYKFFENMGQSQLSVTTSYLISLIDRVNQIYRKTKWGNGFTGVGIGIKEIHIHEEPTELPTGEVHYNNEQQYWDTKELLEIFSRTFRFKDFCLAHLFTHQSFDGGVLGLAYISAPREHSVGGICSSEYYKNGYQMYLNTGWSSSLNRYNRRLLTQEADLVTTHEIGHNWGSEHDPDTEECSPNSFNGGKYIMYTYSVSGYDPNNKIFSACSKRSIGAVLEIKSTKCFSQPIKAYCGNAQVEDGEECDPGALSDGQEDYCCDKNTCKLKPGALCSDSNDVCCLSCHYASTSKVCHQAQNGSCEDTAYCTGLSKDCPPSPHKKNGSECIGRGTCRNGICLAYCESINKMSCACDQSFDDSCKWCCRENSSSPCLPEDDGSGVQNLPDGMPCLQGYCSEGVCEKQVQDLVQRIWDIIEQLGPNKIVAFMRANIVGTVIILSLLLWVPLSCVVCYKDRKAQEKDIATVDWYRNDNYTVVPPSEMKNIIKSSGEHRVRNNVQPTHQNNYFAR